MASDDIAARMRVRMVAETNRRRLFGSHYDAAPNSQIVDGVHAGTLVGVVERDRLLPLDTIAPGGPDEQR